MKKTTTLAIVFLLVVFLLVGIGFLSGYNEVELRVIDYDVETHKDYWGGETGKYVRGNIKNIGNRNLDEITITVKFYDNWGELVNTETATVYNLSKTQTDGFEVYCDSYIAYYDVVDWNNIKFEFST